MRITQVAKKRCFDSSNSSIIPPRDIRKRAPSEESVIFVGSETLPKKISETERLLLKIRKNKAVAPQTFEEVAEVHAPSTTVTAQTSKHFEDISDVEDETPAPVVEGYPSIGGILNISERGPPSQEEKRETPPPEPKPMTESQVWETKLINETEPSLKTIVVTCLEIPKSVEYHHKTFCDNFKERFLSALKRHMDRLQHRLDVSKENSLLLEEAVRNIFTYSEKISEAFHEEQRRLITDLGNVKSFLAHAASSDSQGTTHTTRLIRVTGG
ncbi:uncharacterized protein [Diabrotica undecimpunctata]|uniref:uncharacterized protein isoform X2 n=1 Tax=Diabrotica undecimpunctata TaxID=50387 RepID=UPI003B63FB27